MRVSVSQMHIILICEYVVDIGFLLCLRRRNGSSGLLTGAADGRNGCGLRRDGPGCGAAGGRLAKLYYQYYDSGIGNEQPKNLFPPESRISEPPDDGGKGGYDGGKGVDYHK